MIKYLKSAALMLLLSLGLAFSVSAEEHKHCECGNEPSAIAADGHTCDNSKEWKEFVLTSEGKMPAENGYYYLTQDTEITKYYRDTEKNIDIHLCLNGFKLRIVPSSARLFDFYIAQASGVSTCNFSICDCKHTGQIISERTDDNDGGVVWFSRSGMTATANFYGLDVDLTQRFVCSKGGAFFEMASACENSVINVYGGTYKGGTGAYGGIFKVLGPSNTINFYSVTFKEGTAMAVVGGQTVNGYTVPADNSKKASGGAVYINGATALITDCIFENSKAVPAQGYGALGGQLYVGEHSNVTIKNTKFSGGTMDGEKNEIVIVLSEVTMENVTFDPETCLAANSYVNGLYLEGDFYEMGDELKQESEPESKEESKPADESKTEESGSGENSGNEGNGGNGGNGSVLKKIIIPAAAVLVIAAVILILLKRKK